MSSPSQVESIFFTALERETPQERAAYLSQAWGDDSALRQCVPRLLNAHTGTAGSQAQPAVDRPRLVPNPTARETNRISGYTTNMFDGREDDTQATDDQGLAYQSGLGLIAPVGLVDPLQFGVQVFTLVER